MDLNSIDTSTPLGFLLVVIYLIWTVVKPLVRGKIKDNNNKYIKEARKIGRDIADAAITTAASMQNLSYSDRKNLAIKKVQEGLSNYGITIETKQLSDIVEAAYQKAKNEKSMDNHKPIVEDNNRKETVPEVTKPIENNEDGDVKDFEGINE